MSALTPAEMNGPHWVHNSAAFKLSDSAGDKKLRVDLLDIYKTNILTDYLHQFDQNGLSENDLLEADIANQFRIALEGNEIEFHTTEKPLVSWRPGVVAVKIPSESESMDSYIYLNIKSLAKRLRLSEDSIKEWEAKGNLNEQIVLQLKNLISQQNNLKVVLQSIKNKTKSNALSVGDFDTFKKERIDPIEEFANLIGEENLKNKLITLVQSDFTSTDNTDYATLLASKLWFKTFPDTQLEKVAITKENLPNAYWGTATDRNDINFKGDFKLRYNPFPNDKIGRYAFSIGDYLYKNKPTPRNDYEVPVKLKEGWVLASTHSLMRLGFSEVWNVKILANQKSIVDKDDEDLSKLDEEIAKKMQLISKFSNIFHKDNRLSSLLSFGEWDTHEYLDKDVRKLILEYLKYIENRLEDSDDDNDKQHFNQFINNLKSIGAVNDSVIEGPGIDEYVLSD